MHSRRCGREFGRWKEDGHEVGRRTDAAIRRSRVADRSLAALAGASSGRIVSRVSRPIIIVPHVLSYLLCVLVAIAVFVQRINLDPHRYSWLEWRNVPTAVVSLNGLVPVGILAGGMASRAESAASA
jgi:hypothetical protein